MAKNKNFTKSTKKRQPDASKSTPPTESQQLPPNPPKERYIYNNYIVFVDDPKLKSPFTILQGSKIQSMEKKDYINDHYLNDSRRRRQYDVALSTAYAFPCRIFAKAENKTKAIVLHKVCDTLNDKFKVLMACKVTVETAYQRLMESNPRKVKDGVHYETGEVEDNTLSGPLPDTASSYSSAHESPSKSITSVASDDDVQDTEVRTSLINFIRRL